MLVLVIDRSKFARDEMGRYLDALEHTAFTFARVEEAVETLAASLSWENQRFGAIIITADSYRKTQVMWFLKYLNNRKFEFGIIPTLVQSEDPRYVAEGDEVDLRTLSRREFPFVWYHPLNLKKMGYFQRFFSEKTRQNRGRGR